MIILTIRTDKPEAEIGLYEDDTQLVYKVWEAHRALAETLHAEVHGMLHAQGKDWADIEGIIAFQGPGSFTGLRIGLAVTNALAYSLGVPIVAAQDMWIEQGIARLLAGESDKIAMPEYGSPVNITLQRK
jgi:tRNA threonylcarbamoyladenosine biosynthesis protein TsaB